MVRAIPDEKLISPLSVPSVSVSSFFGGTCTLRSVPMLSVFAVTLLDPAAIKMLTATGGEVLPVLPDGSRPHEEVDVRAALAD